MENTMNRGNSDRTGRLAAFLKSVGSRTLLIQTHDIPDPDAMASAEALRIIARSFNVNARIVVNGLPHRRDNKALIKECKLHLNLLDSLKLRSSRRVVWAFVDCLPGGGNVTLHPLAPGDMFLVIDHHNHHASDRIDCPGGVYLLDDGAGSTATMLTEMLFALEASFPPRLASALSYAILTDTQDFSRGAMNTDLEAYTALFPFTNQRIISRLRNVRKSRYYFRIVHRALENTYTYRHIAWANIGSVVSGETVAEMADYILSCERITWTLAVGYTQKRLFLSMRSSSPQAHCSRAVHVLADCFNGTVGGHNEFAGGFIFLQPGDDPDAMAAKLIRRFACHVLRLPLSTESPTGTPLVNHEE